MAHAAHPLRTRSGWALLLLALCLPAGAATLGDIDVGSTVGEVLDATITLGTAAGAPVGPECIFLSRGSPEDGPFVTRANVSVYEVAGERFLRLKSAEPVRDAGARLRVVVRCPGQPHIAYREYRSLFAPRAVPAPIAAPVAAAPADRPPPAPARAGAFPVRSGDTLQSLAALIFPRNPDAQRAYVEAMRARNPAFATLGPRDPLPADASLELPDLRSLPRQPARAPAEVAMARAPAPAPAELRPPRPAKPRAPRDAEPDLPRAAVKPAPQVAEKSAPRPALPVGPGAPAAPAAPAPPRAAAPTASSGDKFVLRLSSPEVDLTRSRGIDDRTRAKLRERLLVLDSDDQVSALLSLRDSVKRLEGRVAELQLKLSTLPVTLPPKVEPPKVEPPKIEPPKAVSPKVEPPPVKVEPPAPKAEPVPASPPPVRIEPPAPKAAVAAPPAAAPAPRAAQKATGRVAPSADALPWMTIALWAAGALGALLLSASIWRALARRRAHAAEQAQGELTQALPEVPTVLPPQAPEPLAPRSAAIDIDVGESAAEAAPEPRRREMASDAALATEVPTGDPGALRRRYMEERFPEIANGTIVLGDPESVVKAARLFYEDGAVTRAVELLQYSTEDAPLEQKTWLALFEIYRLERLAGPFAELAQRYRDLHGKSDNWRKVQYFGREIDPGNALYRDLSAGIETIKFEAGTPPAPVSFDPVAENWLNAPMDFENELLVVELRKALMAQGKVTDEDLVPNPMPALRRVEMFTVA